MKEPEAGRNRAKDFVDQCRKRYNYYVEKAGKDFVVKVFCCTSSGEWQAMTMAPVGEDFISFQCFDGTTQTLALAPLEQVSVHIRATKREANEKQPAVKFNKEMGFHTLMSGKRRESGA